jgi:hypothetical protein
VGCSRDRVKHFKSFLQKHGYSLEDLLTRHEEVLAFLKAHAKGGNKWQRKKEWNREAWLEEFHRKKAEYIKQCKREAEIRRAKKRAELKEQGIDPDGWRHAPVWFLPVEFLPEESGHIGNIRVYFGMAADGSRATRTAPAEDPQAVQNPEPTRKAEEKNNPPAERSVSEAPPTRLRKQAGSKTNKNSNPEQHENPNPEKHEKAEKQRKRKGEKAKKEKKPPGQAPTQKRGKHGFPSAKDVQKAVKDLEESRKGSDVVVVSRQELEFAIYLAWWESDKEKANKQAVSEFIDRYEGILWRKLHGGYYGLLVGSDKVRVKIRDYVLAKKNGQQPTNGNGSVGSELSTHNGTNGNGEPSANGNGSLGSQSSNGNNGNGKYDIDQIIHTLEEKGSVVVPPQFVHEIVRELRRRGFSVNYWASGLIELAGGDDEILF